MRVSEFYKLGRSQPSLSFVDVKIDGDVRLFVSPRAIRQLPTQWGSRCVSLMQSFFGAVLDHILKGRHSEAEMLLRVLKEPNETHLGLSKGKSQGRGLGSESANDVWKALATSKAAKSGLLKDLEDATLMIRGISLDMISDIATNIIRGPLIDYTQEVCRSYEISMDDQVDSGPVWNPQKKSWQSGFVQLPVPRGDKLLLVPKTIVRTTIDYDIEKYYRHYI